MAAPSPFSLKVKTEDRSSPVGIKQNKEAWKEGSPGNVCDQALRQGAQFAPKLPDSWSRKGEGAEFPSLYFLEKGRLWDFSKWTLVLD